LYNESLHQNPQLFTSAVLSTFMKLSFWREKYQLLEQCPSPDWILLSTAGLSGKAPRDQQVIVDPKIYPVREFRTQTLPQFHMLLAMDAST